MKNIIALFLTFTLITSFAEEAVNITETNCDNETMSVSEALEGNKPLLVIASGYDCSICRNEAPAFDKLADSLVGRATIWGAMNYRFSNSRVPTCTELDSWQTSYGWDNFFHFNDNNNGTNKTWAQGGYTSYTVIDPTNNEYVYKGVSRTSALNAFFETLEKVEGITSTKEISSASTIQYSNGVLSVSDLNLENATLTITSCTGTLIYSKNISSEITELDVNLPSNQVLFFSLLTEDGISTKKIIL